MFVLAVLLLSALALAAFFVFMAVVIGLRHAHPTDLALQRPTRLLPLPAGLSAYMCAEPNPGNGRNWPPATTRHCGEPGAGAREMR